MEPKFKKLTLLQLQQAVEKLIETILGIIEEDHYTIDGEDICCTLADFAGRDYIIYTKIENDLPLSADDKLYIASLIKNNANTVEL